MGDPARACEKHVPSLDGVIASGFKLSGRLHAVWPLLGVYRGNTRARVAHGSLEIRFGHWWFETPLSNISTVTAQDDGTVCITFKEPVHGHEPVGVHHHDFRLQIDNPRGFAAALRSRMAG